MKVNRLKMLVYILCLSPMVWLCLDQSLDLIENLNLTSNKIKVDGAINDAASFSGFFIFLSVVLLCFIPLVTGKSARWIPKIVFFFVGLIVFIAFLSGWFLNVGLKKSLIEHGYVECLSERQLTLKYSSRTYALSPDICSSE